MELEDLLNVLLEIGNENWDKIGILEIDENGSIRIVDPYEIIKLLN